MDDAFKKVDEKFSFFMNTEPLVASNKIAVVSQKTETEVETLCTDKTPDNFLALYMKNLIKAKNKYPEMYNWNDGVDVLEVFRRMSDAFKRGTYDRHSHAIKWTCKEIGIPHTRDAITKIFKGAK